MRKGLVLLIRCSFFRKQIEPGREAALGLELDQPHLSVLLAENIPVSSHDHLAWTNGSTVALPRELQGKGEAMALEKSGSNARTVLFPGGVIENEST